MYRINMPKCFQFQNEEIKKDPYTKVTSSLYYFLQLAIPRPSEIFSKGYHHHLQKIYATYNPSCFTSLQLSY